MTLIPQEALVQACFDDVLHDGIVQDRCLDDRGGLLYKVVSIGSATGWKYWFQGTYWFFIHSKVGFVRCIKNCLMLYENPRKSDPD
jgi:hypothetical protein